MSPKLANGNGELGFIAAQTDDFWKEVGIYPNALEHRGSIESFEGDMHLAMEKLGIGNLRLLCEEVQIAHPSDATEKTLVDALVRISDHRTLIHLIEFMKRRTECIEQVFERSLPKRKRQGYRGSLEAVSRPGRTETLKPLTMLLILFRTKPSYVQQVFYQDLYVNRTTHFSYRANHAWSNMTQQAIASAGRELAERIRKVTKRGIVLSGHCRLAGGVTVFLFLREYTPKVSRDFQQEYSIHYRCGMIVVALDHANQSIHVKCGNAPIADAIQKFFEVLLTIECLLLKNDVCYDYDPDRVRSAILGLVKPSDEIAVVEIAFARSSLPGGAKLSLTTGFLHQPISGDLEALAEHSLVDFRLPSDLKYLTLAYKGKLAKITPEVVRGGAVRFNFDNAGWTAELQQELEEAVVHSFGFPIHRLIHPVAVGMGNAGIYAYLLSIRTVAGVESYHEECLDRLVEAGVVRRMPQTIRGCRRTTCLLRNEPVLIQQQETCRGCDNPLQEWEVDALTRDEPGVIAFVGEILSRATELKMAHETRKFEGRMYYALESSECNQDDLVCLLVQDRLSPATKHHFERFSRPMLVVQAVTQPPYIFVDHDGIGRLSLSYLLAAQEQDSDRDNADGLLHGTLRELRQSYEERVFRAARHAHKVLNDRSRRFRGNEYETEIYNILRALFPNTYQMGREGKKEPDGIVCIPDYRDIEEIADTGSWNLTYDAKWSGRGEGYNLNIDESRKIVEYINKAMRQPKVLSGKDRKVRAHVILSNNLLERKMRVAAQHVFGPDGVKKKARDIRLILMDEDFLIHLSQWALEHSDELRAKRPHFNNLLIDRLERESAAGFTHLTVADANALLADLHGYHAIEKTIDGPALQASFDAENKSATVPLNLFEGTDQDDENDGMVTLQAGAC